MDAKRDCGRTNFLKDDASKQLIQAWIFPRAWAFGLLCLILATWPLWFPSLSFSDRAEPMPMVPLMPTVSANSAMVFWLGQAASFLLMIVLVIIVVRRQYHRFLWWLVAVCLITGFFCDQHRLQPWAYQSSIYAMIFASMDRGTARRWLIPLLASIYIYSSAGKFDNQFAHTVGQDFLTAASNLVGGIPGDLGETWRVRFALFFPAIEIVAGLGILIPWTRRAAGFLVIAMHLVLISILGPWNLNHSLGVVLWNMLLIVQDYLILVRNPQIAEPLDHAVASPARNRNIDRLMGVLVRFIVIVAILAPLLERREYWDHWTSWSLYSPHTSHVDIEFHQSSIDQLSPSLQKFLLDDTNQDGWLILDLGSWSLSARRVPVYPQARYQVGLAAELARQYELGDEIRARLSGVSNRWSGKRDMTLMLNRNEIEAMARKYWLLPEFTR